MTFVILKTLLRKGVKRGNRSVFRLAVVFFGNRFRCLSDRGAGCLCDKRYLLRRMGKNVVSVEGIGKAVLRQGFRFVADLNCQCDRTDRVALTRCKQRLGFIICLTGNIHACRHGVCRIDRIAAGLRRGVH